MSLARLPGLVLVVAGAAIGLEATTFDVRFLTDPVGPKALPMLVALLLIGAGAHATARPLDDATPPTTGAAARLAAAAAAFLVYSVALGFLGFFLSTTLVVGALSWLYGAPLRRGLPAAAALTAVLWLLFVRALALPLPVGDLWIR